MRIWLVAVPLIALVGIPVLHAHEGHKAITTKGVEIDPQGRLHLEPQARRAIGLELDEISFGEIQETLVVTGEVRLAFTAESFAGSLVEGVVERIFVRPGQFVEAGEVLAMIQSIELEGLQLELTNEKVQLHLIVKNLERARQLGESIVAGKRVQELEVDLENAQVSINSLIQKLEALGLESEIVRKLGDAPAATGMVPLLAPQAGFVTELAIMVGRHVEPNEHLVEIQDTRRLLVDVSIPEDRAGWIRKGQPIRVRFRGASETVQSTVEFVVPRINQEDGMLHAFGLLDNSTGDLRPGMFGQAKVEISKIEDAFVIPEEAIVTDGAERFTFVEEAEGIYRLQYLILGAREDDRVEIVEGAYPGDRVVTSGNHELAALFVQGALKISEEAAKNIGLKLAEIDVRSVDEIISVNGQVVPIPDRVALAVPRIAGRVEKIHATLSQYVEAGEALADVHSMKLVDTQLELIQTSVQLGFVERQAGFIRELAKTGISAKKELLELESAQRRLESGYQSLRRTLRLMGLTRVEVVQVLKTRRVIPVVSVRAPISGYVTHQYIAVGQVVEGGDACYEIMDLSRVSVQAILFARDLPQVVNGDATKPVVFRTVAHPDREWLGEIAILDPSFAGDDRTLRAWTDLENSDLALVPGMRMNAQIVIDRIDETDIAVPLQALLQVGGKRYVFVQQDDRFRRVEVVTGREDSHYAEVVQGLFPGDQVVVRGVNEVNNAFTAVR